MDVLELEVEQFLELLFHLLYLCVLLLQGLLALGLYCLHGLSQSRYLLVLLLTHFLYPVLDNGLDVLLLVHDFSQTPYLVLVLLLFIIKLSP